MNDKDTFVIVLLGKSATGKDTIERQLLKAAEFNKFVNYTTRPKRDGEEDGVTYHFVTEEYLKQHSDEVIYKTSYDIIKPNGDKGVWTYAFLNDIQPGKVYITTASLTMYAAVKSYFNFNPRVHIKGIYLTVNDEDRLLRAIKRSHDGNYAEVCRRYLADEEDFSRRKLEEVGIGASDTYVNDDIDTCTEKILMDLMIWKESLIQS